MAKLLPLLEPDIRDDKMATAFSVNDHSTGVYEKFQLLMFD